MLSAGYYVVKLKNAYSGKDALSFFVRVGQSVDIDVPLGDYELVYAYGTVWYGISNLFGGSTTYHRADDTFDFYYDGEYVNGWTVELYLQSNGNLDTDVISADEF